MASEISTLDAVRARMVDRVLVVMAVLMVPATALSWYRALLIGVQPMMFLHVAVAALLCLAALFRQRLSFGFKTGVVLSTCFLLGTTSLISLGQVGLGSSIFVTFIIMATVFLGKKQGWLALGASGGVAAFVAIGVSMGWVSFDFDITDYALSPITWTVYVVALVFLAAVILTVLASIHDVLNDSIDTLQQKVVELAAARDQAEVANRSKNVFMSNISHEFRTPLNAIIGFANLMKRKTDDAREQKNLATIETSGQALTTLVSSILDLSRIESGDLKLNLAWIDLQSTLQSSITRHERDAVAKSIQLALEIGPNIPALVQADEGRLHQVLHHLVGNAIKFTNAGSVTIGVDCHEQRDGVADLSIWVADTGIGIPENERESIFKPFTQMDGQSIDDYGGTGVGLALARHLVEAMGGVLTVESTVGEGSRFEVLFNNVDIRAERDAGEEAKETEVMVLSDEVLARLPELFEILDDKYLITWTELLGRFALKDIEAFSVQVQELGTEYGYLPLTAWGKKLQKQVQEEALEDLAKTMEQFVDVIDEVKTLIG